MTFLVRAKAKALRSARDTERRAESELLDAIRLALSNRGEAKIKAAMLEISPQHLSDIRAGRRGITDDLVRKLVDSKGL